MCTKFYQNQLGFVKDMRNTFWCVFFGSQCILTNFNTGQLFNSQAYVSSSSIKYPLTHISERHSNNCKIVLIKCIYVNVMLLDLPHCLAFSMNAHGHRPVFTSAKLLFHKKQQFAIKLSLQRLFIAGVIERCSNTQNSRMRLS